MKENEEVARLMLPELQARNVEVPFEMVVKVVALMKERVSFVKDLWEPCAFFFVAPVEYDEKTIKKRWKEDTPAQMRELVTLLQDIDDFSIQKTEEVVMNWVTTNQYHMGNVMNAFRLTLVGEGKGPHIFEITDILGKEETIRRIERAVAAIG